MLKLILTNVFLLLAVRLVFGEDSDVVPGLHGPGCIILNNTAYSFGGAQGLQQQNLTNKIFKMDLTNLDHLFWENTGIELPREVMYPHVFKKNATSNKVYIVGGFGTEANNGIMTIDLSKKTPSISEISTRLDSLGYPPQAPKQVFPYGGGMVQSDINPEKFIMYDSIKLSNNGTKFNFTSYTFTYNVNTNLWVNTLPTKNVLPFYQATFHVYKGVMYAFGGTNLETEKTPEANRRLNEVLMYDLKSETWSSQNFSGTDVGLRNVHSSVLIDNLVYIVGGANPGWVDEKIAIFNLDTKLWSEKPVKGLRARNQGCLLHHQGKLIYTLGFLEPFNSTVQIININTWEAKFTTTPVSLGAVLGGLFGGAIGLLLIIIAARYLYKRHMQMKTMRIDYLKQYDQTIKEHKDYLDATVSAKDMDPNLSPNLNKINSLNYKSHIDNGLDNNGADTEINTESGTGLSTNIDNRFSSTLIDRNSANINHDIKIVP